MTFAIELVMIELRISKLPRVDTQNERKKILTPSSVPPDERLTGNTTPSMGTPPPSGPIINRYRPKGNVAVDRQLDFTEKRQNQRVFPTHGQLDAAEPFWFGVKFVNSYNLV